MSGRPDGGSSGGRTKDMEIGGSAVAPKHPERTLGQCAQELSEAGIEYLQVEIPDIDGSLRGKLVRLDKGIAEEGSAFCQILFGLTVADDVYETSLASFDNGFPDFTAIADPATVQALPWRSKTAAALCDLFDEGDELNAIAPRTLLRRAVQQCEVQGFQPRMAMEFEVFVLQADDELIRSGRHHELKPVGRTNNAYSLGRVHDIHELATDFMSRMRDVGVPIEAVHSELGYGLLEFTISHAPALEAADRAIRAKTYFNELCKERGLVATFMAKWQTDQSGSGGHIHQSLWSGGENAFARGEDGTSATFEAYVGGLVATLPELCLLFNPTVNSYRRLDASMWSPVNATWGVDNRTTAIRAIDQPYPGGVRLEHRRAGADANPYLIMAAMLAGGVYGIEKGLTLPAEVAGNAGEDASGQALPADLGSAIKLFENSTLARELLGGSFVEHYVASRRTELSLWEGWLGGQVSSWELNRYFENS